MFFLASIALAQEPQTFDPVPADVKIGSKVYSGILVDESTFAELGRLRVQVQTQNEELKSFEEWKAQQGQLFTTTLDAIKEEHELSQQKLVDFYESELQKEKTKDLFQRHAFPLGLLVGFVGSSAMTMAVINAYDATLPANITGK